MIEVPRGSVEFLYVGLHDELSHLTTLVGSSPRFDVAKRDTTDWLLVGEEATLDDEPLVVKCLLDTRELEDGEYDLYLEFDNLEQTPRVGPMSFTIIGTDPGEDASLASIYQKRDEKGQVSGYASLGSDGLVPTAQLPANIPSIEYLEWTATSDLTQATVLPAGSQMVFAWALTDIEFDDEAFLNFGTIDVPDAYLSEATVKPLGQIWTINDLGGRGSPDPNGFPLGFPVADDCISIFPAGTTLTGTLTLGASTIGRVRIYFLSCVPSKALSA